MKKKLIALTVSFLLCLSCFGIACTKDDGKYHVGICQFVHHAALDAATEGFQKALIDILGADKVEFDVQNGSEDSNICITIVNTFVNKKMDLIMANATPALQVAKDATLTIPILGTSVTDYASALNLSDFNGIVGSNISGTSDLAPLDQQAAMILEFFPDVKNVGFLFCSDQVNSEYQVKFMENFFAAKGIATTRFSFSDSNDVAAVTQKACVGCDVLFIPTDNKAASAVEIIAAIVKEAKLPVFAGEQAICKACGVATLSISYYDLGYKTGEMAAKILKGEANISEMAIEYAPATKMYNKEVCESLGIKIPAGYEAIK